MLLRAEDAIWIPAAGLSWALLSITRAWVAFWMLIPARLAAETSQRVTVSSLSKTVLP